MKSIKHSDFMEDTESAIRRLYSSTFYWGHDILKQKVIDLFFFFLKMNDSDALYYVENGEKWGKVTFEISKYTSCFKMILTWIRRIQLCGKLHFSHTEELEVYFEAIGSWNFRIK